MKDQDRSLDEGRIYELRLVIRVVSRNRQASSSLHNIDKTQMGHVGPTTILLSL